jgi:hypothetical protein
MSCCDVALIWEYTETVTACLQDKENNLIEHIKQSREGRSTHSPTRQKGASLDFKKLLIRIYSKYELTNSNNPPCIALEN